MELYIAGGVGEHGRNCFYVKTENLCFLVDCGLMAKSLNNPYPHLSKEEIDSLDVVFLTHSHNDHTGALPWLFKQGFNGPVIATKETLSQLNFKVKNSILLETIKGEYKNISIKWGRSGHCPGSVWYKFKENDKSILFSGDYIEDSQVFVCDPIREETSNIAIIDSAYGNDDISYEYDCNNLINKTEKLLDKYGLLLFPVPKYGRGLDLIKLFSKNFNDINYYGDEIFLKQVEKLKKDTFWYKQVKINVPLKIYNNETKGIVFISNPQLKNKGAQKIAEDIISLGGYCVMTGTVEEGTYSAKLIDEGKMDLIRYPVHLNYKQYLDLIKMNNFMESIPYHSYDFPKIKDRYYI